MLCLLWGLVSVLRTLPHAAPFPVLNQMAVNVRGHTAQRTHDSRRTHVTDADQLLDGLDPEQREVATSLRGPVTVIAGAGTGKTRAITHRIAYGVASGLYEPSEVLAVTFTTRAAGEMRGRLSSLGAPAVQARTFHSAALRQARYFWPQAIGTAFPQIIDSKFGLVGAAARRVGVRGDNALIRDLSAEVEWAKVSTVAPADYPARARTDRRQVGDLEATTVSQVLASYE